MPKTKIGIFFLEDEPDMFELLKDTCPEEYKVLGEAKTCKEAREKIPELVSFDEIMVTILDGNLPDGYGEDIALEFKRARRQHTSFFWYTKKA